MLGRLLCFLGRHKWEYIYRLETVSRGCLRCGKCEVQIYEVADKLALRYGPKAYTYWHPAAEGWTWPELKKTLTRISKTEKVIVRSEHE